MYKKILLAADGSEHSLRAANQAIKLAKCGSNSLIEVVYVVDSSKAKSEVLHNWNSPDISNLRKEKVREVEAKLKEADLSYEVKLLKGEPGPVIVDYANHHHFDIIVIGSRGLNTLQEMVLGSVSHKVAKRANGPVLIVK